MDCPKCLDKPHGEFYAAQDKLWCEFEAQVIAGWLYTVYYCRRCDWMEEKKFSPQVMHDEN